MALYLSPNGKPRSTFRVRQEDKERARQYYESNSTQYNMVVARGPLRVLRERERSSVLRFAQFHHFVGGTMIDVGTGGGFYALNAKKAGMRVCAVDYSRGMIDRLARHVDEAHVADLEQLKLERQYDVVVCAGVLEFVLEPERAFANLCRLVKPGGRLIIQSPRSCFFGWFYRLEKRMAGISVNLYTRSWFEAQARCSGLEIAAWDHPLPYNQVILLMKVW